MASEEVLPTKAECQERVEAAVRKYMDLLGLSGAWHWQVRFASDAEEVFRSGSCAAPAYHLSLREGEIIFHELAKPEHYEELAAHEVLHFFFANQLKAIDTMPEPAQSVLDADLHANVTRLAFALTGTEYYFMENQRLSKPPWEGE